MEYLDKIFLNSNMTKNRIIKRIKNYYYYYFVRKNLNNITFKNKLIWLEKQCGYLGINVFILNNHKIEMTFTDDDFTNLVMINIKIEDTIVKLIFDRNFNNMDVMITEGTYKRFNTYIKNTAMELTNPFKDIKDIQYKEFLTNIMERFFKDIIFYIIKMY